MSQQNLYPSTIIAYDQGGNGGWAQGGVPTIANMNKQYGQWDDSTANHCFWADNTGPNSGSEIRVSLTTLSPIFVITSVSLTVRIQRSGGTYTGAEHKPFIYIGSTHYYVDDWTHTAFGYYNQVVTWTTNPATALPFTRADINSLQAGLYARNLDAVLSTGPFLSALVLTVVATGAPAQNEQARDVASRHQWRVGRNIRTLKSQPVRSDVGHALDIMGVMKVAHTAGPEASGNGWHSRPWQLRHFQVRQWEPRDDGTVAISGPERRETRALFVSSEVMPNNNAPLSEDGVLRFHKGCTITFTRTGAIYTEDPGSGLFVLVNANEKSFGPGGYEAVSTFTAYLNYSAFQTGDITGWTKSGTGTNGSAIAADTAFAVGASIGETFGWDPDSTGVLQNALFTAGSPHTADLKLTSNATLASFSSSVDAYVGIWFTDYTAAGEFSCALQRQSDSKYYNFSTRSWQVAIYWQSLSHEYEAQHYPINARGTQYGHQSWHFGNIDVGSITTLKLILGFPSGTTAGSTARAYAAQIGTDNGSIGRPPLLLTSSTVSRNHGLYKVTNSLSKPAANNSGGSLACTVVPNWYSASTNADVSAAPWLVYHDSSNHMVLYWTSFSVASGDFAAGPKWIFQIKAAGTRYRVSIDTTVVGQEVWPNQPIRLIARWTGAEAEHGLPAYTMTLFLIGYNYVIRSNDVQYVTPTPSDSSYLEIGRATALGMFEIDGAISRIVSRPYPPTDEECYRRGWTI